MSWAVNWRRGRYVPIQPETGPTVRLASVSDALAGTERPRKANVAGLRLIRRPTLRVVREERP